MEVTDAVVANVFVLLQGAKGVVRPTGDGFWQFKDVLLTYTATESKARRPGVPVLAIALPVVFGVLLLVGGSVLAWWCMRKRERCVAAVYVSVVCVLRSNSSQPEAPILVGGVCFSLLVSASVLNWKNRIATTLQRPAWGLCFVEVGGSLYALQVTSLNFWQACQASFSSQTSAALCELCWTA
jgi:hypothetical protein